MATTTTTTTVSVFVTTYGVGNEKGFAFGQWFDLSDYSDKDEFIDAAIEYAEEELGDDDPELCFSDRDFEHKIFKELISECNINDNLWSFMELSENELEVISAYAEVWGHIDLTKQDAHDILIEAEEAYQGYFDSDKDFTHEFLESTGAINEVPDWVLGAIDFDILAKDLMMDYASHNGHYFRM